MGLGNVQLLTPGSFSYAAVMHALLSEQVDKDQIISRKVFRPFL